MITGSTWMVLPAAFLLDLLIGDPQTRFHPIRWMGYAITTLESRFRKLPVHLTIAGLLFSVFLISCTWGITSIFVKMMAALHPIAGILSEILLIYFCISARALSKEGMSVGDFLEKGDLATAKKNLSLIVGRDVERLDQEGVARAAVETMAENLVDGVISPLFYAAIGGAPLALAFKMVSTLDSMVGYKNETYLQFGKASAKIDDIANFIPARFAVPVIAIAAQILFKQGRRTFSTAVKEGKNHSSPNSGYSEAAFAGALGVKFGGPNFYHGNLVEKPYIGSQFGAVSIGDIRKANRLLLLSAVLGFVILWGITLV